MVVTPTDSFCEPVATRPAVVDVAERPTAAAPRIESEEQAPTPVAEPEITETIESDPYDEAWSPAAPGTVAVTQEELAPEPQSDYTPTAAETQTEIKFAIDVDGAQDAGSTVVEPEAIRQQADTIHLEVLPSGELTSRVASSQPTPARSAPQHESAEPVPSEVTPTRRELVPLVVTPRMAPVTELAASPSAEPAEAETAVSTPNDNGDVADTPAPKAEPIVAVPSEEPAEVAQAEAQPEATAPIESAVELKIAPIVKAEPAQIPAPAVKPEPATVAAVPQVPTLAVKPKPVAVAATPQTPERTVQPEPATVAAAPQVPVPAMQPEPAEERPQPVQPLPELARTQPEPASQPLVDARVNPAPVVAAQPSHAAPLPRVPAPRSPAMVATLAQADGRVRHAIQLAEKGALFASRKEFMAAINLIAQAQDIEHATRQHSRATVAGFLAMKEANDFFRTPSGEIEVRRLVSTHKTPVLHDFDVSDMPPAIAAQYYFNYAKEQLATGVGRETVGSIALYGLAKLIVAGAGHNAQQLQYTGPAMAMFQASLICEPQNFRAAHELGVLLASSGQLELAREMLMGSAEASPQPMIYKNLAVVHSRLGEQGLAAQAQQNATALQATHPDSNAPNVQWVDPATFAAMTPNGEASVPPPSAPQTPAPSAAAAPKPTKQRANVARGSSNRWNPLNLRR